LFPAVVGCVYLLKVVVPFDTLELVTVIPTSEAVNVPQLIEPAVDPAFKTFPLLLVPVAGTCKFPSPVG